MRNVKVDRLLTGGIGVLLVALVALLYNTLHETVVTVGDSAPSFSVTADNGRSISPANFGGKVLVLNFWATWCAPCVEEIPSLDQLQRRFKNRGLVVLAISVDKDESAYKDFLRRVNVDFLTTRDPAQKISADYGTLQFPETYIIDSRGKIVSKIISATNWTEDKMINYVDSLLGNS